MSAHLPPVDYRAIVEGGPLLWIVMLPDAPAFTILGASDEYLKAMTRTRESVVGLGLFEAFPQQGADESSGAAARVRNSLERVLSTKAADVLPIQTYDIPRRASEGAGLEVRVWSRAHFPVIDGAGRLTQVVQRLEIVSEVMLVRAQGSSTRARVLLVEGDAHLRESVGRLLAVHWEIEMAADGVQALELLRERVPDLLLSGMQGPTGVGFLETLRGDPSTASIPVVRLSAPGVVEGVSKAVTRRDDCVVPSFSPGEIVARVRMQLDQARIRSAWTKKLESAHRELDAFCYSMAHDLRAPLRAIVGFSQILFEDYRPKLDDEGQELVRFIVDNGNRMGRLIEALLTLSRLAQSPILRSELDMGALARAMFDELLAKAGQRGNVALTIHPLVPAQADRAMMKQVWTNLLSNALKYSAKGEKSLVEIGMKSAEGSDAASAPVYFVRDNGVGFDMKYANKLFGVFQRLHRAEDFDGTGVGLAIVDRIVRRHGGRVWAEAGVDQGATFYFSLPERDDPDFEAPPVPARMASSAPST